MTDSELGAFWAQARQAVPDLPVDVPEAWAFGATPEHAEELLALVLAGTKTATAGALWDYEADGDALPVVGGCSVILDGSSRPRAVTQDTAVRIVRFDEVDEAHAFAEGEGDRSLVHWRQVHEHFWRTWSTSDRAFEPAMPVVCVSFVLRYSR